MTTLHVIGKFKETQFEKGGTNMSKLKFKLNCMLVCVCAQPVALKVANNSKIFETADDPYSFFHYRKITIYLR